MAAAAIERLFEGDDAALPNPGATVLWLSDQPEINEQTRRKMLEASSLLESSRLVVIDATFDNELFSPGKVYFLNTQKLGKDKQLVTHGDERNYTIWETINNTARARPSDFFVFIDEAHRGMLMSQREQSEASSIVQKFIIGSEGEIDAVPIIIGISATPERFRKLVQSTSRTQRPIDVPAEDVRASGLIVDAVRFYYPSDKQPTDMTMLRAAASSWKEFTGHWEKYCLSQDAKVVKPILVVQVQDASGTKISETNLGEAIAIINDIVGQLPVEAFAPSFQEGATISVGTQSIRYLAPSDINSNPNVVVVFFKMSLNTGWDCPRAEVMMSFRKATDATLIAQLVGRMVRTPLARRIESDELLNTVSLYLPHYDESGLKKVVEKLRSPDTPVAIEEGVDIVTLSRRKGTQKEFAALSKIPSYVIPRARRTKGVHRLMKLARLLAYDDINPDAVEQATNHLLRVLDSEYERLSKTRDFEAIVERKGKVEVKSADWQVTGNMAAGDMMVLDIAKENLDDLFDAAGRKMGEGLHKSWWKHRAENNQSGHARAKLEAVAFCIEPKALSSVERESQKLARRWLLSDYEIAINALSEDRKQRYDEVKQMASQLEETTVTYPEEIQVRRGDQSFKNHLYVDQDGLFPFKADSWESGIIEEEFQGIDSWLRNFDRKSWSLTIPYKVGIVDKGFFPDFLAIRIVHGTTVVDLVDPHHTGLADAVQKALGLASYAAKHADRFGRIELIAVLNGKMKRLDLKDEEIRERVSGIGTTEQLERLYEEYG